MEKRRGHTFGEKLRERHLQALWYDREIRPREISTVRGDRVRVVYPGDWNCGGGPDFTGAVLELGAGRRICGDVEIHLHPSAWKEHRHAENPAYRNIVAHVFWLRGKRPADLPRGAVSIDLGRFAQASFHPSEIDLEAYPFGVSPAADRPCRLRLAGDRERALALLREAGMARLRDKAERFASLLAAGDRREVFYRETMAALGYSKNARAFREIARRVPLRALMAEPQVASAALVAAGGFGDLETGGMRPANLPARRLAAAGILFSECGAADLADATDFSPEGCRDMVRTLRAGGLVGAGRAAAIVANTVVPMAIAEGRLASPPERLPPEDVPRIAKLTAQRVLGPDIGREEWARDGICIQGLVRIRRECCLVHHPDCDGCAFGSPTD